MPYLGEQETIELYVAYLQYAYEISIRYVRDISSMNSRCHSQIHDIIHSSPVSTIQALYFPIRDYAILLMCTNRVVKIFIYSYTVIYTFVLPNMSASIIYL